MLISKFPRHIRDRWNRKASSFTKANQKEPILSDLFYFIGVESALVNAPLLSKNAVDKYLEKLVEPARRSLKVNFTGAKEDLNQKKECQMCQKNHDS